VQIGLNVIIADGPWSGAVIARSPREPNMSIPKIMGYLALSALAASSGCGTMANLDGRPLPTPGLSGQEKTLPFGGVKRDMVWMKSGQAPDKLKYAADLPLSFFGDIFTLPKTIIGTHSDDLLQGPGADLAVSPYAGMGRPSSAQ
jgi:hypothetical protein